MNDSRTVKNVVAGYATSDGAGVKLVRVLGPRTIKEFDPFLMLDAFDSLNSEDYIKGFPWHPHRGIETITYLVEGRIEHGDSLGNRGVIEAGGCQWMTAGSGIIHQEMPQESPRMLGLQVWLNLPGKDKMCVPAYGDISADMVPVIDEDGTIIRIIGGIYRGKEGAFQGRYIKPLFLDLDINPGRSWSMELPADNTAWLYLFSGSVKVGTIDEQYPARSALLLGTGANLELVAGDEGMRGVFLCAPRLQEPVAWGGPIVMNTHDELETAWRELDEGTFIRKN